MPEIVWKLQAHEVVLKHEQVKREVLDPVIDVPSLANTILNQVLLLDEQLVTLDGTARHEENVRILYILRVLQQQLVNDHLD